MKKERAAIDPVKSIHHPSADNSAGTASVTLGIVSIVLSLFSPLFGIMLGLTALIFGLVQRRSFSSRWSTGGIMLGIIALLLSIVGIILTLMFPQVLGALP